ncbi:hypothetical protein ACNAW0_10450 [Micromonospora sp. SL1-18]|uniref:hypothetical protein n=1 Tax=Micromonospora sp. SL1-18 TaxID=3399128 RepID=UPI003A4DFACC
MHDQTLHETPRYAGAPGREDLLDSDGAWMRMSFAARDLARRSFDYRVWQASLARFVRSSAR